MLEIAVDYLQCINQTIMARIEMLMGMEILDEDRYARYRAAMLPILQGYGAGFGYDLQVASVLRSETDGPINRVFTIYFPSEEKRAAFFADPAYIAAKQAHFVGAVGHVVEIARYTRP